MGSDKTDVAVAPSTKKKSDDRFYLMEMSNRPVMYGDIGSLIRLEGVVIGGGGAQAVLMLPGSETVFGAKYYHLTLEEWSDWLTRSDTPEILIGPSLTGPQGASLPKIWHRKLRYEVSGSIQQRIWAADNFQCVYCGARMGKVLMTVDHFWPLENGGVNNETNFVSACRPCNKSKGSQAPDEWLVTRPNAVHTFETLKAYLANRKIS